MKILLILLSTVAFTASADEMLLRTGEKLAFTKILKIDPDGLRLLVPDGVKKLAFSDMTDEARTKYGLTEKKADEYKQNHEEAIKQAAMEAASDHKEQEQANKDYAEKKANTPFIINAEQMKKSWILKLQKPASLDSDYRQRLETYNTTVAMIGAGKYDSLAQERTLEWNISEYERTGNPDLADRLRPDLVKVRKKISEEKKFEQDQQQLALELVKNETERQRILLDAYARVKQAEALRSWSYSLGNLESKMRIIESQTRK